MDKFKVIDGNRAEAERDLVEALLTPWDKPRLAKSAERIMPKGKLTLVSSAAKLPDEPELPDPSGAGKVDLCFRFRGRQQLAGCEHELPVFHDFFLGRLVEPANEATNDLFIHDCFSKEMEKLPAGWFPQRVVDSPE